ncbi:hypothetical protein G5V58_23110 [Nocardioides anomalus]|uniref:Uncharacterized protein n=1 Tax=Nocardioides anomalus TaxID=2712223 RepID=A0A6G6WIV2_9ACTN|nr:hypothetical protein [Nocardioides anomalus]QIG45258.1 hypothetical protein G5V58_23110 [Nocardioides anomalus]
MAEGAARARWRDALVLAVLAVVILGGVIHYGRGLAADDGGEFVGSAGPGRSALPSPSPSAQETAQLESGPPTDPAEPPAPAGGTCWDGRATTSLRLCGLPEGARGLAWVFPSFEKDRPFCHKAPRNADSYRVVASFECFQRAAGQPVTVVYDQVQDPERVEDWLLARLGRQRMHQLPGSHGGRCVFTDGRSRPARITGTYERFPYVVSVYAQSPQAAKAAWQRLTFRDEAEIRGTRAG